MLVSALDLRTKCFTDVASNRDELRMKEGWTEASQQRGGRDGGLRPSITNGGE